MVYGSQNTAEERADIPSGQDHCSLKEAERKNHGQHGAQDDVLDDCTEVMLTAKQSMASASPNNIASVMYMFACFCLGLNVEYDVESTADT